MEFYYLEHEPSCWNKEVAALHINFAYLIACKHLHAWIQYRQLLLEDHQSAVNYVDYIRRVEEQYNDTMNANPGCGYCTRFMDTKLKMEQLLTTLDALVWHRL